MKPLAWLAIALAVSVAVSPTASVSAERVTTVGEIVFKTDRSSGSDSAQVVELVGPGGATQRLTLGKNIPEQTTLRNLWGADVTLVDARTGCELTIRGRESAASSSACDGDDELRGWLTTRLATLLMRDNHVLQTRGETPKALLIENGGFAKLDPATGALSVVVSGGEPPYSLRLEQAGAVVAETEGDPGDTLLTLELGRLKSGLAVVEVADVSSKLKRYSVLISPAPVDATASGDPQVDYARALALLRADEGHRLAAAALLASAGVHSMQAAEMAARLYDGRLTANDVSGALADISQVNPGSD